MLTQTNQPLVLQTERLALRGLKTADVARISLYSSDWRVSSMTTLIPHPNPPEVVSLFLERVLAPDYSDKVWAIDATKSYGTDLVGLISLRADGSLGYWLGSFFWGLGIATEALSAVVAHASEYDYPVLTASVFQGNAASRRVLEKNGFALTGEGEDFSLAQDKNVKIWELERLEQKD